MTSALQGSSPTKFVGNTQTWNHSFFNVGGDPQDPCCYNAFFPFASFVACSERVVPYGTAFCSLLGISFEMYSIGVPMPGYLSTPWSLGALPLEVFNVLLDGIVSQLRK